MPVLKQSFTVSHPREHVWQTFQDLELIVQCIPGASLVEPPQGNTLKGNTLKGRMTVKLGPVKADFGGEAEVETDASSHTGTITGRGVDKSHASRAKGEVVYRLDEAAEGSTVVNVDVDYSLSGSLAQFARGGIVEAVADQITKDFVANLEGELNASGGAGASTAAGGDATQPAEPSAGGAASEPARAERQPARPEKRNELNVLSLFWAVLRSRVKGMFGRR